MSADMTLRRICNGLTLKDQMKNEKLSKGVGMVLSYSENEEKSNISEK